MASPFHGPVAPNPSVYSFQETYGIRIVSDEQGNPWFVLSDVCKAIDYKNSRDAQKLIDVDDVEKRYVIDDLGRQQEAWCCTEPGLYQFLCSSQVDKAKPFRRWVFAEVLPAIRRQGYYGQPLDVAQQLRLQAQLVKFLASLKDCRCAFSRQIVVDCIRVVCRQLAIDLQDLAKIGADPAQTGLEGF